MPSPVLALLLGVAGILLALWPSDALWSSCPAAVRAARTRVWALFGVPGVGGGGGDGGAARLFTVEELRGYDGSDASRPILLGMAGDVFDVTEKGRQFYGPGAAYSVFAGRDATRALTLGSLEAADLTAGVDDFNEAQLAALKEQHAFYLGKYPRVGSLQGGAGAALVDHTAPPAGAAGEGA
jgi:membrane-associated progesterone receptor component